MTCTTIRKRKSKFKAISIHTTKTTKILYLLYQQLQVAQMPTNYIQ